MVNVSPEVRAVFIEETGLPEAEADILLADAPESLIVKGRVSVEVLMFYYMLEATHPHAELDPEQKQRLHGQIMAVVREEKLTEGE